MQVKIGMHLVFKKYFGGDNKHEGDGVSAAAYQLMAQLQIGVEKDTFNLIYHRNAVARTITAI